MYKFVNLIFNITCRSHLGLQTNGKMNNYHIILLVTEEQEKAIIGLFAARRWMYMKAGTCSSTNHIDFKGKQCLLNKPRHAFCIIPNKVADQLCSDSAADHCLCFPFIDNTITLHLKSGILK